MSPSRFLADLSLRNKLALCFAGFLVLLCVDSAFFAANILARVRDDEFTARVNRVIREVEGVRRDELSFRFQFRREDADVLGKKIVGLRRELRSMAALANDAEYAGGFRDTEESLSAYERSFYLLVSQEEKRAALESNFVRVFGLLADDLEKARFLPASRAFTAPDAERLLPLAPLVSNPALLEASGGLFASTLAGAEAYGAGLRAAGTTREARLAGFRCESRSREASETFASLSANEAGKREYLARMRESQARLVLASERLLRISSSLVERRNAFAVVGLAAVFVAFVGAGVAFTALFTFSITRPLFSLVEAVRAVARREYPSGEVDSRKDEIGVLGREIREMARTLESSERELIAYRDGLERKVGERSRELIASEARLIEALKAETEARRQAEDANRVKGVFLSTMSHELRTPLNGILGYAQILARSEGLRPDQRKGLAVIQKSGEHLLSLINDILDLSRMEAGRLVLESEPFELRPALGDIADMVEIGAREKGLRFDLSVEPGLPPRIVGDQKRISQILLNLLSNAVKFTDEGRVGLEVSSESGLISFRVSDSGVGIDGEAMGRLFKPFSQVGERGRKAEGSGLGLAISRRLAELMGGSVSGKSVPGSGSAFTFSFPLAVPSGDDLSRAANGRAPASPGRVLGYSGERKTVLVADDSAENREVLRDTLEQLGFSVTLARDGQEALGLAMGGGIDLVFMDIYMPVMTGIEAIMRLRAGGNRVPVIAISASIAPDEKDGTMRAGADAFLPKPFRHDDLVDALGRMLGLEWVRAEEGPPPGDGAPSFGRGAEFGGKARSHFASHAAAFADLSGRARSGDVDGIHAALDLLPPEAASDPAIAAMRAAAENFRMGEVRDILSTMDPGNPGTGSPVSDRP